MMPDLITEQKSNPKNRFRAAPRHPDFTIDQDWDSYSAAEHDRWDRLFLRSLAVLRDRACDEFMAMANALKLSDSGIPDMGKLSDRLEGMTGWRVVPVAELVPDDVFFNHLAKLPNILKGIIKRDRGKTNNIGFAPITKNAGLCYGYIKVLT